MDNKPVVLTPIIKELLKATREVNQWQELGVALNVPSNAMKIIKNRYSNNLEDAKIAIFKKWTERDEDASWSKLASALVLIGYGPLADSITTLPQAGKL